jgi:NADH:ubiquinone oxidoreductase subunit 6 (subunit J)
MDTLIKSYQPIRSEDELYLWIGAVVALLAFGAMGFVIRKEFSYEEQSKKWLIALLLFIVGLIASGTAVFFLAEPAANREGSNLYRSFDTGKNGDTLWSNKKDQY